MRILYDYQIFSLQRYGGISRYFYELIKRLNELEEKSGYVSVCFSNNFYIEKNDITSHFKFFNTLDFRGKSRALMMFNGVFTSLKLIGSRYSIYHPTYYNPGHLKLVGDKPVVVTVYDMIHERFPELFPVNDRTSMNKKIMVKRADVVIAISESTKNDLVEIFDLDPGKIRVILLANTLTVETSRTPVIAVPDKFILFVGLRDRYKNFDTFVFACQKLLAQDKELMVVCIGGGKFSLDELSMLNGLGLSSRFSQRNASDEELAYFYEEAICFVYPSLYEGFGIPILEAFACGCPLVCSNSSSMPEVAADAAIYFDPTSVHSMYNSIKKVLEDGALRSSLVNLGQKRLMTFSWERVARETYCLYKEFI